MSCLKIVSEPYLNRDALELLIHGYVFRKAVLIGGAAVDPVHAAEQMHLVKDLWFQNSGRQLKHFVLCFTEQECSHLSGAGSLQIGAYEVCDYFAKEYQIVFGIHQNYNKWHIHFVMNNISFVTGKRYREQRSSDLSLKTHISTCLFPTNRVDVYYG